ncbi:MAG: holo-ACP synthase [Leptonema sp. (in: bacteria)]
MIVGIGIDIIEHKKIQNIYSKYGEKFLRRYFGLDEIEYSLSKPDPIPYLSARFAAKEAVIKSLNLKKRIGLFYKDIEIKGKHFGKKELLLKGEIKRIFEEKKITKHHLSISHSENYSIAMVILES